MVRGLIAVIFFLHVAYAKIDFLYPTESRCDCKLITECNQINELTMTKKWNELKNGYTHCGFNRKVPKYCCPSELSTITTTESTTTTTESTTTTAEPTTTTTESTTTTTEPTTTTTVSTTTTTGST